MRLRKILGVIFCLILMLALWVLPAAANANTKDDVQKLVKSFPGTIDLLEGQEYTFWTLVFDYISLKGSYTTSYSFNAKETNVIAARGLDIAKLHIQVIDADKKVIAEVTDKTPLLEFTVPTDGDYDVVFSAETLETGVKKGLSSYFGYLLEWK